MIAPTLLQIEARQPTEADRERVTRGYRKVVKHPGGGSYAEAASVIEKICQQLIAAEQD